MHLNFLLNACIYFNKPITFTLFVLYSLDFLNEHVLVMNMDVCYLLIDYP